MLRCSDDLKSVLDYLSTNKNVSSVWLVGASSCKCLTVYVQIGLYGRSMGAATAMLVAADERWL
eukprot:762868-Hanusia_phi.AAC.1